MQRLYKLILFSCFMTGMVAIASANPSDEKENAALVSLASDINVVSEADAINNGTWTPEMERDSVDRIQLIEHLYKSAEQDTNNSLL